MASSPDSPGTLYPYLCAQYRLFMPPFSHSPFRFWGVIYPLKRKLTRTRAKVALVVIWVAAFTLALAQLFVSRARRVDMYVDGPTHKWICEERWAAADSRKAYTVSILAFTYVIPLAVITFTYYKVGSKLWVRNAPGNAHQSRDQILLRSKRKVSIYFTLLTPNSKDSEILILLFLHILIHLPI